MCDNFQQLINTPRIMYLYYRLRPFIVLKSPPSVDLFNKIKMINWPLNIYVRKDQLSSILFDDITDNK